MNSRSLAIFGLEFERRLEKVDVPSRSLIDTPQGGSGGKSLQSTVTNQLADDGAVLLLYPRLIILAISPARVNTMPCSWQ